MGRTLRVFGTATLVAGGILATAVPSAAEPSATIDDITMDGCDVVVTFTVGDAGQYDLEVWDDNEQIGDVPVTAEAGATVQGRYTITAVVKQGASGLGIIIAAPDGVETYDEVDPYNGADDIVDFCRTQNPVPDDTTPTTPTTPTTVAAPPSTIPVPRAAPARPVARTPRFTG